MKEKQPIKTCNMCGYLCALDRTSGGRYLEDLNEKIHFLPTKIEDCEARLLLSEDFPLPKDIARSLVQIPRDIK